MHVLYMYIIHYYYLFAVVWCDFDHNLPCMVMGKSDNLCMFYVAVAKSYITEYKSILTHCIHEQMLLVRSVN